MHDSMPEEHVEQFVPNIVAALKCHCGCFVCSRKRVSLKENGSCCLCFAADTVNHGRQSTS